MKNTKLLVLFLIIFVSWTVFAQEDPDPETSDPDSVTQEDSDQEVPDQEVADQDSETTDQDVPGDDDPGVSNGEGQMIGGKPAMSWEDGGQDFFVMFNSNLDDKIKLSDDEKTNPQGDTCLDSSSFTLNNFHIPEDAIIEKAYLVWMGAVDPAKLNDPTDNKVHLAFKQTNDPNVEYANDILSGEEGKGKKLNTAPSFDFEGIRFKHP